MARGKISAEMAGALRSAPDRPATAAYSKQRARRRAHLHALINLLLQVFREAAQRSAREAVSTIEVRLALHVLRPFVREQRLLVGIWKGCDGRASTTMDELPPAMPMDCAPAD